MTAGARRWTRAEVDDAVAKWKNDLEVATENVLELMDDFHYKWLAGDGGRAPAAVKGLTEREVTPALQALHELWQVLPALNEVIDEVNLRHKNLPRFQASNELLEIQNLLEGESVKITTRTTYAERGLLTPDEVTKAATPARILGAMVEAYGQAKTAVVKVGDAIRQRTRQLDQATREIKELLALAHSLGEPPFELGLIEEKVSTLKAEIMSDPLSVAEGFDREILPAIELVRQPLHALQAERDQLHHDIASGDTLVISLEQALARATMACDERMRKVMVNDADRLPAPFETSVVDELRGWLRRLESTLEQGKWAAAKIGFANWKAQLDARLSECETVAEENERPLNRRRELRGLLEGLKAKAVDTGLGEDDALAELYRRAYDLLYSRPTPMPAAEKLVSDYLAAVR